MAITSKQIEGFLARIEPDVAKAFRKSIKDAQERANIGEIEKAIKTGTMDDIMRAAGFTQGTYSNLLETIRNTYRLSGEFTSHGIVPARMGFLFDMYNPRVQDWLAERSSFLIRDITEKQVSAIQNAIQAGYRAGRNPRSTALDIVGRIGPNGRRTGGVIGLHEEFAAAVSKARDELDALNPAYFRRERRDKRFDKLIRKAIAEKNPLTPQQINKIAGRYEDLLLQLRAENIARTETKMAFENSAQHALEQLVDDGHVESDAITKEWSATGDHRTRPSHLEANGQKRKLNEFFNVGGYRMLHPGDVNAPPSETNSCRCITTHRVDFSRVN